VAVVSYREHFGGAQGFCTREFAADQGRHRKNVTTSCKKALKSSDLRQGVGHTLKAYFVFTPIRTIPLPAQTVFKRFKRFPSCSLFIGFLQPPRMLESRNNLPANPFLPFSGSSATSPGPEPRIPRKSRVLDVLKTVGPNSGHTDAIPKP
jgi:hypothetical protein